MAATKKEEFYEKDEWEVRASKVWLPSWHFCVQSSIKNECEPNVMLVY